MITAHSRLMTEAFAQFGAAQVARLVEELPGEVHAAAERLQDADAEHRLLDHGGEIADLILGAAGQRLVARLVDVAQPDQRDGEAGDDHAELPGQREQNADADEERGQS